jgi:hypothetical protein
MSLSILKQCFNCHYAERQDYLNVMLNGVMLSVAMLNVVVPSKVGCLRLESTIVKHLSGPPLWGTLLALLTYFRLGWTVLPEQML